MVDIGVACMDRYEAPNRAGEKPLLMQSALDGVAWCEARGKRLCREDEWMRACNGPAGHNYPYGARYRRAACNDDKEYRAPNWETLATWPAPAAAAEAARLEQAEPAGSRPGCQSADGVFDLTGNAAEWVVRTHHYDIHRAHILKGCYWARCYRPPHVPSCAYVNSAHASDARSYEMGFRCCRDRAAGTQTE
jgi:formylglycine-generating enzyme required for sulfatase activity